MSEPNLENYPVDDRPTDFQPFSEELPPPAPETEHKNDLLENPPEEEEEDEEAIY